VRGRYNTKVSPHAQGSRLFLLDGNDRIDMLKAQIGVHYYFKAVPVNTFQNEGDISEVTAVGLTIQGWAWRPYAPGSVWQEENGVSSRGRTKTLETDITIAWNNCTKNIGFGTFPYNTRGYGDYEGDDDITTHEIDVVVSDVIVRTADTGLNQTYTYTEAFNIEDNGGLANDVTFRVYTKSIYGRSRYSRDKTIEIIE
jgi:hypothetical protein